MAKKTLRYITGRIDIDLDKRIRELSKKENISYREASREIAKGIDLKNKLKKQIKI